ncbi:hypothetical protein ANTPLA_LOCUS919 [Anthophora plagiata]
MNFKGVKALFRWQQWHLTCQRWPPRFHENSLVQPCLLCGGERRQCYSTKICGVLKFPDERFELLLTMCILM